MAKDQDDIMDDETPQERRRREKAQQEEAEAAAAADFLGAVSLGGELLRPYLSSIQDIKAKDWHISLALAL